MRFRGSKVLEPCGWRCVRRSFVSVSTLLVVGRLYYPALMHELTPSSRVGRVTLFFIRGRPQIKLRGLPA